MTSPRPPLALIMTSPRRQSKSSRSKRATSEARSPRRTSTNSTAASRRPRAVDVSQLSTSRLASAVGIADGSAVRGHALSDGTAVTNGAGTRPVTYAKRKNERRAVTMQRSDGAGITIEAARMVASTEAPSSSDSTASPCGCHIARKPAICSTY